MIERIECWEIEPKIENFNKFTYIFPKDNFINTSRYPFSSNPALSIMKDDYGNYYKPLNNKLLKFFTKGKAEGFMVCRDSKHFIFGPDEVRAFIPTAIYDVLNDRDKVPTIGWPLYILISV